MRGAVQYLRTVRYIETNPLRAQLVCRAEDWRWTSLSERLREPRRLGDGPVALPSVNEWVTFLNGKSTADSADNDAL